ncbi:MAG: AsmA family protein [Cytophagales bacterium]
MKKLLITAAIVVGIIFLLLFALPFLFKDKIKAVVDEQINNNVNATVFYNADKFGLSFFKQFPALTATLGEFGVVGFEPFEGDTLLYMKEFNVSVDVFSLIGGKQMKIKSILLDKPNINVIVLPNGMANYNIAKPSTDTPQATPNEEPTKFSIGIEKWEILNGNVIYDDRQSPMYAQIIGLNHKGKGDFTQDIFDLDTKTTVDSLTYSMDTVTYLKNHQFDAKLVLNIDNANSKYTFKDNLFKINDFGLAIDGFVQMNKDSSIAMDMAFKTKETAFSSVLSLIPAIYMKDFKTLKTSGQFAFDAYAKGTYKGTKYPGFGLNLNIKDGFVQYPSLPSAVKNISLVLNVDDKSGNLDSLVVDLKQMHVEMGSNPFDAKLYLKGLNKKYFEANLKGILNLAELTQLYPMKGMELKGLFNINASAKGFYDPALKKMPNISATMGLKDGYVKTDNVPAPIEQINLTASVENTTGMMEDMKANLSAFQMVFDGEPLEARATVEDFTDYTYSAFMKGKLNMEKLTKLYPLDGMEIKGFIDTEIDTKGKMSLLTAKKYDELQTSGKMNFTNFSFKSKSFTQGIVMTDASMIFDPKKINIPVLKGFLGKSDIDMTGTFSNYMGYVFKNETIVGKMTFNSNDFDVNEWMGSSDTTKKVEKQKDEKQAVAAIPKNLDISMVCKMKKVLYSTYDMSNMSGIVTMKDGVFALNNGFFNMIDADFKTNMKYDTRDLQHPLYGFDLDIKNLEIKKAYDKFEMVKKLASIAKDVDGKLATTFNIYGELGQDYSPLYPTTNGKGQIFIADAVVKNISYIAEAKKATKLDIPEEFRLQNTKIEAEIISGRVFFKPFDVKAGSTKMNISGSQGLDQTVDYLLKTSIPASGIGQAASGALASIFGKALPTVSSFRVDMSVKGTSASPKVSILSIVPEGSDGGNATKPLIDELKHQAEEKLRAEGERLAKEALERAAQEAAKRGAEDAARRALEEAKKKLPNIKFP